MSAPVYDMQLDQGGPWTLDVFWREEDEVTPQQDITGWTARCQLRDLAGELAVEATAAVVDGPNAKVRVSLTDEQTAALEPGRYRYDVEIESLVGATEKLLRGTVKVNAEATF